MHAFPEGKKKLRLRPQSSVIKATTVRELCRGRTNGDLRFEVTLICEREQAVTQRSEEKKGADREWKGREGERKTKAAREAGASYRCVNALPVPVQVQVRVPACPGGSPLSRMPALRPLPLHDPVRVASTTYVHTNHHHHHSRAAPLPTYPPT